MGKSLNAIGRSPKLEKFNKNKTMNQSEAKITIEQIENQIIFLKPNRSPESLKIIEQIELLLIDLKAEIEKELPTIQEEDAV